MIYGNMDIENVLKNYNIEVKDIKEIKKGYSSKKWIVCDNKNKQYLIKMLGKEHFKNFPFALEVQDELNYETPKIEKTKDKELCIFTENYIFYITELIDICEHVYTAYEVGKYLGHLHDIMSKIKYKKEISYIKYENNLTKINYLLNERQEDLITKILKYKKEIVENIAKGDIELENLNLQIIHGDYYNDNLVFTSKGLKIIDFDQCCIFYREYEMLRGFFISIYDNSRTKSKNLSELSKYICGYKKNTGHIDAVNAYKLYLYIQANSLAGIAGKTKDIAFAKKRYDILTFLVNNQMEIIKIIDEN